MLARRNMCGRLLRRGASPLANFTLTAPKLPIGNLSTAVLRAPSAPKSFMRNMSISVRPDAAATDVVKPVLGFLTGGGLLAYMKAQPFYTNLIIATVKTALCDLLVQRYTPRDSAHAIIRKSLTLLILDRYIERRETIDWRRNAVFVAFGGIYLGAGQWFLYQTLFARWFPGMAKFAAQPLAQKLRNVQGMRDLAKQIAVDNFFHYTFIYFPVFYALKECMQGESSAAALLPNAMRKYASNAVEDNVSMWLLWVPCDAIIYAIPLWMRLPANHAISFCWTCYLSFLRGGDEARLPSDAKVAYAQEAAETPKA